MSGRKQMKTIVSAFLLFASSSTAMEVWPDLSVCRAAEWPALPQKKKIEIAKDVWIEAVIEITSKGNGGIDLPGLMIRVYDCHDDGWVFRDCLLKCEWRDEDGDGFIDLVVSGIASKTHEKTGAEVESRTVQGVFRYAAKTRQFERVICSPQMDFWKR